MCFLHAVALPVRKASLLTLAMSHSRSRSTPILGGSSFTFSRSQRGRPDDEFWVRLSPKPPWHASGPFSVFLAASFFKLEAVTCGDVLTV